MCKLMLSVLKTHSNNGNSSILVQMLNLNSDVVEKSESDTAA